MTSKISPDITVKDLLESYPQLLQLFLDLGLLCVGCPAESFHTLAEVAHEYKFDLDQFLTRIDRSIEAEGNPTGVATTTELLRK